jgi:hypothetical protein
MKTCEKWRGSGSSSLVEPSSEAISLLEQPINSVVVKEELESAVCAAVEKWRAELWERDYKGTGFGKVGIKTDKALEPIAQSNVILRPQEDFLKLSTRWPLSVRYGTDLLCIIKEA